MKGIFCSGKYVVHGSAPVTEVDPLAVQLDAVEDVAGTHAAEGVTAGVGQRERLAGGVRPNADADLTTGANGCVRAGVDDGVDGHFSVPFLVSVNEVFRTSCNVLAQDCESDCSHSQSCASKC